jgi:hypothetical protein
MTSVYVEVISRRSDAGVFKMTPLILIQRNRRLTCSFLDLRSASVVQYSSCSSIPVAALMLPNFVTRVEPVGLQAFVLLDQV